MWVSGQVPIGEDQSSKGEPLGQCDEVTKMSSRGIPYERVIQRMKELPSHSEDNVQGRWTEEAKASDVFQVEHKRTSLGNTKA